MFNPTTFTDFESQAKAMCNFSLHGQRLSRQFERVSNELRQLQKARQTKEKSEPGFVLTHEPAPKVSTAEAGQLRAFATANATAEPSPLSRSAVSSISACVDAGA